VTRDAAYQEHCQSFLDGEREIREGLAYVGAWRQRHIRGIERRLEAPPLAERRWYRLSEVLAQCVPNDDPKELARYHTAFERSLQGGTFSGGNRNQTQIFFASPSAMLGPKMTRLTWEMFRDAKRVYDESDQSEMPVWSRGLDWWSTNAKICWIPRGYVVRWLQLHGFSIPECFDVETLHKPRKKGAGRRAQYDWEDVDLFVQKQLNEKGDFAESKNWVKGWRSLADLERLVEGYIERREGKAPARSTIRERIGPMIDKWRKRNSADN
jgi:hypothetical protein